MTAPAPRAVNDEIFHELQRAVDAEPPIAKRGGGGNNGGMEARIAKLEATVEHINRDLSEIKADLKDARRDITSIRTTDFRLTFGAIIVVALGLASLMAKGFGWI